MFVALHWKTFEPTLPNMPAAAVMLVITPYVTGQKPLHKLTQGLVMRRLDHKVKMIRHQREGIDLYGVTRFRQFKDGKKGLVVMSLMKDSRTAIPSIDHMINKTSLLPARDSRHEQALSQRHMRTQWEKVACPL